MIYNRLLLIIYITSFILILTGCFSKYSSFQEGFIITSDDIKYSGYVKIDSCKGSVVHFIQTSDDSVKPFSFSEFKTAVMGNDSFIVIKKRGVKDITTRYYNYRDDIIVKVIENGTVNLYKHCITDYRSSMFKTEKHTRYSFIISKKQNENIYSVPFEPANFLLVAKMFFGNDVELMAEINRTKFLQEIVHAETGEKFKYKSVSVEQILKFVRKFNLRAKGLNK